MNIYFAAPLFDDMELARNIEECAKLEAAGHKVFLPQRDAGEAASGLKDRGELFIRDCQGIKDADVVIAYLDGRVPDEGTVFECGMAYALGKKLVYVVTDRRSFMQGHMNVMLEESAPIVKSTAEALRWLTHVYWRRGEK